VIRHNVIKNLISSVWKVVRRNAPPPTIYISPTSEFSQLLESAINKVWFLFHRAKYRKFVTLVKQRGYDTKDIWYSRKLGFMCWPPEEGFDGKRPAYGITSKGWKMYHGSAACGGEIM